MAAALPRYPAVAHQAEVGLVYEGGCLQGVIGTLASHLNLSGAPQLLINHWQKSLGGRRVAGFDLVENASDFGHEI
jgi:hypothetical protein